MLRKEEWNYSNIAKKSKNYGKLDRKLFRKKWKGKDKIESKNEKNNRSMIKLLKMRSKEFLKKIFKKLNNFVIQN